MSRKKKIVLDFSDDIEDSMKPWTCPACRKTYAPPLTTYVTPIDGLKRCEKCAAAGGA